MNLSNNQSSGGGMASEEEEMSSQNAGVGNNETVNVNLKLIEASLRCLANLYSSAQMAASLVVTLDSYLYVYDLGTKQAVNMESLLKLFQLGRSGQKSRQATQYTSSVRLVSLLVDVCAHSFVICRVHFSLHLSIARFVSTY